MLSSIDHINIVVTDMERTVRFYTELLGLTVSKRVSISGEWIDRTVGLSGTRGDVVYLELPAGPRIELIRYVSPTGTPVAGFDLPNAPGIRHMAFKVSEIDEIVARLTAGGVPFQSEVQTVPDSQVTYAGGIRKRLVYFHDPEGNILELCEYA